MKLVQRLKINKLELILLLAIAVGLIIRLYLSWLDIKILIDKVLYDDAFIFFTLARNMASGNGVSFDGLSQTNGFHPLFTLLLVPIFKFNFADINTPVHIALTMLSVFNVLTAIFIFKIVEMLGSRKAGLFAALLWLFNPSVVMIMFTGVEAGLYAFLISITIFCYLRMRLRNQYTIRDMLILGILVGVTFLGRTDAIFLFIAIFLDLGYKLFRQSRLSATTLSRVAIYSLAALAVVSPWLIWNLVNFGTIMQTSGQATRYFAHQNYIFTQGTNPSIYILMRLASNISAMVGTIFGYLIQANFLLVFATGLIAGIILAQIVISGNRTRDWKMGNLNFALLFVISLVAFYALWQWFFMAWYFMSILLVATLYIGLGADCIARIINLKKYISPNKALILTLVLMGLLFGLKSPYTWQVGNSDPGHHTALYQMGVYASVNVPENERITVIESGLVGYYSRRTVINLDGYVDNAAAEANMNHQTLEYIEKQGITYIVLDRSMIDRDLRPFVNDNEKVDKFLSKLREVHRIKRASDRGDLVLYQIKW